MVIHFNKRITQLLTFGFVLICLSANILMGQDSNCNILHNGIDLQTKNYRIETSPSFFFNYTIPEIKNELQQENLIQCQGQLVKIDDKAALHLNLKVNSLIAPSHYGEISPSHMMKITLIDGKEVKISCFAGSKGVMMQNRKGYIYPLGYELSSRDLKQLGRTEIDKIGIQWSTGYEEYIIYEVDFMMNQIACLNQAVEQKPN